MSKNSDNTEQKNVSTSRRDFIKKAAYTAPALVALGSLSRSANADCDPFIDPDCNGQSGPITSP